MKEERDKVYNIERDSYTSNKEIKIISKNFTNLNKEVFNMPIEDIENSVVPITLNYNDSKEREILEKVASKNFDNENDLNEVLPLIYASIIFCNQDMKIRPFKTLEHLLLSDSSQSYIKDSVSVRSLIFSCMVLESSNIHSHIKYYAITYLLNAANKHSTSKKPLDKLYLDYSNWLFAAYLIDQNEHEQAIKILEKVKNNSEISKFPSLERIFTMLAGDILKRDKQNHDRFIKGLEYIDRYEQICEQDKASEWRIHFITDFDA